MFFGFFDTLWADSEVGLQHVIVRFQLKSQVFGGQLDSSAYFSVVLLWNEKVESSLTFAYDSNGDVFNIHDLSCSHSPAVGDNDFIISFVSVGQSPFDFRFGNELSKISLLGLFESEFESVFIEQLLTGTVALVYGFINILGADSEVGV